MNNLSNHSFVGLSEPGQAHCNEQTDFALQVTWTDAEDALHNTCGGSVHGGSLAER